MTRLVRGAVKGAHGSAGVGVVWCTQLHGAVQVQLQRFRCEAKHLKAVANSGTFSVAAELSGVVEEKGNRVVVCAPGKTKDIERWRGEKRAEGAEVLAPVLEQDVVGALGGVRLWRLRGPALVDAQQEEVCRLRDPHLHIHLRPGRPSFQDTKTLLTLPSGKAGILCS